MEQIRWCLFRQKTNGVKSGVNIWENKQMIRISENPVKREDAG